MNRGDRDSTHEQEQKSRSRVVAGIAIAIAVFGVIVAAGVYWSDPSPDWRKPLVVLAASGVFLGVWGLALRSRNRSRR